MPLDLASSTTRSMAFMNPTRFAARVSWSVLVATSASSARRSASREGPRPALVCDGVTVSYQELDEILNLALRINDFLTGIFIGIGLLILSLRLIGEASHPLRDSQLLPVIIGYLASDPITAFIVAAIITPPDVVTQTMIGIPMVLLYILGIGVAYMFTTKVRTVEGAMNSFSPIAL